MDVADVLHLEAETAVSMDFGLPQGPPSRLERSWLLVGLLLVLGCFGGGRWRSVYRCITHGLVLSEYQWLVCKQK